MKLALLVGLVFALPRVSLGQDSFFGRTDTQKEIEMGRETYDYLVSNSYVSRNEAYVRRVQRVLAQLLTAMPEKLYPYQAVVLGDNEVNALCAPGGYIVVHEGLLTRLPDDNQLAFVLAHEIGHGARRHTIRLMRKMQTELATQAIIAILLRTQINSTKLNLASIRFTREHETEADAFGTELYLRAGFEPKAVADGMRVMAELDEGHSAATPDYLQTHPDPHERVAAIEQTRDRLIAMGLKPMSAQTPDLSVESVFGKIPSVAPQECHWMKATPGDTWTYEISGGAGGTTSYSLKAVGTAVVGSTAIVRMELEMTGKPIAYQMILDGDRIWRRNRPTDPKSIWTLEVVMPLVGESEGDDKVAFMAVALETVQVPAGKFENCLQVKRREGETIVTSWYAPRIGLVRRVNEATGTTEVLVSYRSS